MSYHEGMNEFLTWRTKPPSSPLRGCGPLVLLMHGNDFQTCEAVAGSDSGKR